MLTEKTVQKEVERQIERLALEDFSIFLLEKWRISSGEFQGEKYSLHNRPYMLDILKDDFPFQATLKSAQCGITELKSAKAIFRTLPPRKGNVLYTLPAGEQMQQLVDARIRNAILTNQFLKKFVTGSLNLKKFSINNNTIYFRGVQNRRQIITVDVSIHFGDEIDEYDEGALYTLRKRLGASKNPIFDYFSTPTYHGTGVSLFYYGSESQRERGSDQRVWTIKCESCGQYNEDLIWPDNVLDRNRGDAKFSFYEPDVAVICRHCKKELNRLSSNALWVPKITANTDYCHGYHISKLFAPYTDLNEMMRDSQDPLKEQEFYNSDLGLPYEPKGSKLTDDILDNCRGTHTIMLKNDQYAVTGADIGNVIHAVTGIRDPETGKPKIISVAEMEDWDDLKLYCRDLRSMCVVVDANPEKDEAIQFQKEYDDGVVWLAYYMQHLERTKDKFSMNFDDMLVYIHRTLMMQITADLYTNKQIVLPMDIRRMKDFYEHLKSPVRALKQDIKGDWVPFYPKTRVPDHYFHANLYMNVAWLLQPAPASFRIVKTNV
jgi:hypothetical protein